MTRGEMFEQLQMVLAGEDANDCLKAVADTFSVMLIWCTNTPAEAERLLDIMLPDLKGQIRENWEVAAEVKARWTPAGSV